jgi:excisionase family DNA binding protein
MDTSYSSSKSLHTERNGGKAMNREHEEVTVEKWVNLKDIAEHLSVSQDTVRTWIKEGKLPFYKAGKSYKFKISEVDEWVREGRIQD